LYSIFSSTGQPKIKITGSCSKSTDVILKTLRGPKVEIGSGVFTQIGPVWLGDLENKPKNPKLGWFRPENRQCTF
jgi:tRNA G26 N,N-dimethylase Trm1